MDSKYGYVDWPEPEEQTRFQRNLELFEDAVQSVYNVFNWIWFDRRKQKVKIRIDRQDTWSMDHTLAPIILPMLVQLKAKKHGAPFVDNEDVPEELQATKDEYNKGPDAGPKHFERWEWVLDEMIWAFEQKCRDDWTMDYYGPYIEGEGGSFLGGHFEWTDREGIQAHQLRMTNGFRLFGKYYEHLWH
jgi:hypothetical protein